MKIKRETPFWDHCNTSMGYLWEKIEAYFIRHPEFNSLQRFYSDFHKGFSTKIDYKLPLDVITFGDTFKKMFESGLYANPEVRFWNIGRSFKNMQDDLFFKEESVNLIPRYELFDRLKASAHRLSEPMDLIYAGRISAQKNIEGLLLTVFSLQKRGVPCRLHLFGAFDNQVHEHRGRFKSVDYQQKIEDLINDLSWADEPILYGLVDSKEWAKKSYQNPTFISLSTNFQEDFGVAVAQAQEEGWPIIVSDFGGHKDILSEAMIKIPAGLCPQSHWPVSLCKELAEKTADYILKEEFSSFEVEQKECASLFIGKSLAELDHLRRELVKSIGPSAHLVMRDNLNEFADTPCGSLLIYRALDYLEGPAKDILLISEDITKDSAQEFKKIMSEWTSENRLQWISTANLKHKDSTYLLLRANKIFVTKSVAPEDLVYLKEVLGLSFTGL
ncbi:MAG: glycosyltransferase [Bacteriovoracaceae bacterium]|nr:glycosyltransferase [Bacteriovoracaceae bacterium]